jgi:hypothetical protein
MAAPVGEAPPKAVARRCVCAFVWDCCARAARGHATDEPAIALTKSRRRIAHPKAEDYADFQRDYSRDLRSVEWGSGVSLRCSNLKPFMSALGQKQTSDWRA